jgi:hypothetical protein
VIKLSAFLKPVVVLLISILLFAGFFFLADIQLPDFIQTHFYNPSMLRTYVKETTIDAEIVQTHIFELQDKFYSTLNEEAVCNSFLYNQTAGDIFERSKIYGMLLESTIALQSVQFVDSNGIRMHYSVSPRDIISQNPTSTSYRNYTEDPLALTYDMVCVLANETSKITMDEKNDRIIFSFPFHDSMNVYHGTALFTVSIRALAERLIAEGRIKVNEDISVIREPLGILLGISDTYKANVSEKVSTIWRDGIQGRVTIDAEDSGAKYSLITVRTNRGIFFGRLVNDALFSVTDSMKLILNVSIFLTFYLMLLFLTSLKADSATVVRTRLNRLKGNLFEQLYSDKSTQERIKWLLELEQRRDEIRTELKSNLRLNANTEKNIDRIINKSWDELLAIIKAGSGHAALVIKVAEPKPEKPVQADISSTDVIDVDDAADTIDVIDIVDVADIADIADVEEIEDIDEVESIEDAEAEELAEALDDIDELDEIEEISEFEELEEEQGEDTVYLDIIEDIEQAEKLEELDNLEKLDDLEEIDDLVEIDEDLEKIEEILERPEDDGLIEIIGDESEDHDVIEILTEALVELNDVEEIKPVTDENDELEEIDDLEILLDSFEKADEVSVIEDVPPVIYSSGGLLKLASKYEKIPVDYPSRGLLKLASEIEQRENQKAADDEVGEKSFRQSVSKGLLFLASKIVSAFTGRGLLAKASAKASLQAGAETQLFEATELPTRLPAGKGLLALASKIEFEKEHPADDGDTGDDLVFKMEIVSPFSTMFSDL